MYSDFLEAKYGQDSPGSDRFRRQVGEYHASQIAVCERKLYWAFTEGTDAPDGMSFNYFELGHLHEQNFGAALAWQYGDFDQQDLGRMSNDELITQCDRVKQDVEIQIEFEDFILTGESDWVVFESDAYFDIDTIYLLENGERYAKAGDREIPYDDDVHRVIETKTTKSLDWKAENGPDEKHVYQCYAYMHAMNCDGIVAYIERNTIKDLMCELTYDEARWLDAKYRLQRHHQNLTGDALPPTTGTEYECRYCDFKEQCQLEGGSVWN